MSTINISFSENKSSNTLKPEAVRFLLEKPYHPIIIFIWQANAKGQNENCGLITHIQCDS